ncbi:alpha/beta hydrolase family protein [Streptomyces sp. NPDC058656]|uniref:alpha/beta hydrolase family protein n=1 Tax=unclassified Streptomyces TaxID=2593676 RepID=UPI003655229C
MAHAPTEAEPLTAQQAESVLDRLSHAFVSPPRSPILHTPEEENLEYEAVTFPSSDGVPLEGWLIPADSRRLVIANHPMGFNRSGLPSHLEPWASIWRPTGNDFEVNFVPDYRILHEAGYNVLAYDLRNMGLSGAANGGAVTSGLYEARDVLGSIRYAANRGETKDMTVALFSRCLGANSTFAAMRQDEKAFQGIKCLVACQPVSDDVIMRRMLDILGVGGDRIDELDRRVKLSTSIGFQERPDAAWAKYVRIPTYLYGVYEDSLTVPSDLEEMFKALDVEDKRLEWVRDTTARWDGYLEFQRRPEPILDWLSHRLA